jgi:hypothetical protein
VRWAEASRLEVFVFRNFIFYPLKLDLRHFWTDTFGIGFGFLVFLVPTKTRV